MTAQAGSITSPAWDPARRALRRDLRAQRRALPAAVRAEADRAILATIKALPEYRRARRVALFLAFDGEPSLGSLVAAARRHRKKLYVPVVRGMTMTFAELATDAKLEANVFGILEPKVGASINVRTLDLVLTPLVAFDDHGVRVGVGRGYYDRAFQFLRHRSIWRRPKLIGVAYELQRVAPLVPSSWDVPLFAVVTESKVRRF